MKFFFVFLPFLVLLSCGEKPREKVLTRKWSTAQSTKMNQALAKTEEIDINLFLARHENWHVTETGSGLRFILMKKGDGPPAMPDHEAKIQQRIALLDGTVIYQTEEDEMDVFMVNKSSIESGIQEGIKLMHVGDRAKLVMPSHLAHGFLGDMGKIPPLSPLVVDVELVETE